MEVGNIVVRNQDVKCREKTNDALEKTSGRRERERERKREREREREREKERGNEKERERELM